MSLNYHLQELPGGTVLPVYTVMGVKNKIQSQKDRACLLIEYGLGYLDKYTTFYKNPEIIYKIEFLIQIYKPLIMIDN